MWDPISTFFCMWVLNVGMPEARLKVSDVIEDIEQHLVNETIQKSATLRNDL